VIYGDSDSLFTKNPGASREDYEDLAAEIDEATGLPIKLDRHFKFLVLLPKTTDPRMEAARRYYGKLTDGNLFYRGVELRRRDSPPFINRCSGRHSALDEAGRALPVLTRFPRCRAR